jgi:hypothetical protein
VRAWLEGEPAHPALPAGRRAGRNVEWGHLCNRDILSMPDKWEYPWFAAWDRAFHMIPFARIDPHFAKEQLLLMTREWYMHPNGQLAAYEFAFGDVNPPFTRGRPGASTRSRSTPTDNATASSWRACFKKLLLNFTWRSAPVRPRDVRTFQVGFLRGGNPGGNITSIHAAPERPPRLASSEHF